jgi:hypothetical protein
MRRLRRRAELTNKAPPGARTSLGILTAGAAWVHDGEEPPRAVAPGGLWLFPRGRGHRLYSDAGAPVEPLSDLPVQPLSARYQVLQHGGGGTSSKITYGVVRFDQVAGTRLIEALPDALHIDTQGDDADGWLGSTVDLIAREARTRQLGGETVLTRLADIIVIQAIRSWLGQQARRAPRRARTRPRLPLRGRFRPRVQARDRHVPGPMAKHESQHALMAALHVRRAFSCAPRPHPARAEGLQGPSRVRGPPPTWPCTFSSRTRRSPDAPRRVRVRHRLLLALRPTVLCLGADVGRGWPSAVRKIPDLTRG